MVSASSVSLLDLSTGEKGKLVCFHGQSTFIERLIDMGFHENVEIEHLGRLPFSGPIVIRCDQTLLALRAEEAQCVKIQKV